MKRVISLLSLLLACSAPVGPPRGQLLLYIDTDAPVPSSETVADDVLRPAPLFDHLYVEVFGPNDTAPCAKCSNEFELDSESLTARRVSFGIALLDPKPGYRARLRMYSSRLVTGALIPSSIAVDRWVELPPIPADQITTAHVFLTVDDVGRTADESPPIAATLGPAPPSLVGTWQGAQRSACIAAPQPDRACVPGGAYWAGSNDVNSVTGHSPGWHRLVTLSPYWIDTHEFTAREFRELGVGFGAQWSGSTSGATQFDWCTLTAEPSPRDPLPMNCVLWAEADAVCKARGGSLPTVAQFTYVATKLGAGRYVWGYDLPACNDAVWGRGGFGIEKGSKNHACRGLSTALGAMGGPEVPGFAARDRISLFGVEAIDLAGNVAEYARDAYVDETHPCFREPILVDPVCTDTKNPDLVVKVGGGWLSIPTTLRGDRRVPFSFIMLSDEVGFRCAYPDK